MSHGRAQPKSSGLTSVRIGLAVLSVVYIAVALLNYELLQPLRSLSSDSGQRRNKTTTSIVSIVDVPSPMIAATATNPRWVNDTDSDIVKNKTLYLCGSGAFDGIANYVFPDFTHVVNLTHTNILESTGDSILLYGMWGSCPRDTPPSNRISRKKLVRTFQGKVLYTNGEPMWDGNRLDGNLYAMGSVAHSTAHTLYVTQMAMTLFSFFNPEVVLPLLTDHDRKPRPARKDRFCIFPVSSCHVKFRLDAAEQLTAIGTVYHFGKCRDGQSLDHFLVPLRNESVEISGQLIAPSSKNESNHTPGLHFWRENFLVYPRYRFCLVMENTNMAGYITEKMLNAFLGGCIPIYYGTPEIFAIYNARAFVYYNISDPKPALERIRYLEMNRSAYDEVMHHEPILANGTTTIEEFFSFSDNVGNGTLKRRIRTMLGVP